MPPTITSIAKTNATIHISFGGESKSKCKVLLTRKKQPRAIATAGRTTRKKIREVRPLFNSPGRSSSWDGLINMYPLLCSLLRRDHSSSAFRVKVAAETEAPLAPSANPISGPGAHDFFRKTSSSATPQD